MRYLRCSLAVFGLGLAVPAVAEAQSPPPCAAFDTCRDMPNPYYDGPLMPTLTHDIPVVPQGTDYSGMPGVTATRSPACAPNPVRPPRR